MERKVAPLPGVRLEADDFGQERLQHRSLRRAARLPRARASPLHEEAEELKRRFAIRARRPHLITLKGETQVDPHRLQCFGVVHEE